MNFWGRWVDYWKEKQNGLRYELIAEQLKQAQGITEQLKAENAFKWASQKMNNIRSCAIEIVNKEIIFA